MAHRRSVPDPTSRLLLVGSDRLQRTEVALSHLRPADLWRNNVTERIFRSKANGRA